MVVIHVHLVYAHWTFRLYLIVPSLSLIRDSVIQMTPYEDDLIDVDDVEEEGSKMTAVED